MPSACSRRTVLRAGGIAVATALAGCGGQEQSPTQGAPETTATTDADGPLTYTLNVKNELNSAHEITISVYPLWEDGAVFEKTVTLQSGDTRTWEVTLERETEYGVDAEFDGPEERMSSDGVSFTPGTNDAPPNRIVGIKLVEIDSDTTAVFVSKEPEE